MRARDRQSGVKQAFRSFCLYALSFAGFLYFWAASVFGHLPGGLILWLSVMVWIGAGIAALHLHIWSIDSTLWQRIPLWRWVRSRTETLVTAFILWNISNVVVLALDASQRVQGTSGALYPWFMFLSISAAYGTALFLCGSLAILNPDHQRQEE
ncbi:MAG: hypothetical protein AAF999_05555 [Pseudomonadota bacterium]